jgi:hypothetical protein
MGGRNFGKDWWREERKRAMESREKEEGKDLANLERESELENEIFLVHTQIKILWKRNYQIAPASSLFNTALILNSYIADIS